MSKSVPKVEQDEHDLIANHGRNPVPRFISYLELELAAEIRPDQTEREKILKKIERRYRLINQQACGLGRIN